MKKFLLLFGTLLFVFFGFGQTVISLGSGTETSTTFRNPFAADFPKVKYNFLITKSELETAGASGGVLSSIGFNLISNCGSGSCGNNYYFTNITLNNFTIKLKNTTSTSLSAFEGIGTVVYEANVTRAFLSQTYNTVYWVDFVFNENGGVFEWNGLDNLLVELCYERSGDPTFHGQVYVSNHTGLVRRDKRTSSDAACDLSDSGDNDDRRIHIRFSFDSFLPIELNNFSATCQGGQVQLNWSTITEQNNHYFTVEKSEDGFNWQVVDSITGAGTSLEELTYSLMDVTPYNGVSFYRLKQTDFDGKYTYFNPVSVVCEDIEVVVSPNPSDGLFKVSGATRSTTYFVYDAIGQLVLKGDFSEEMLVDISHLACAPYFLIINEGH